MRTYTIRGYFREGGKWHVVCDTSIPYRFMNVDVCFMNKGLEDETQFSIKAYNTRELEECFQEFCKENDLPTNCVYGIHVVEVAEEKDLLS